MRWKTPKKTLPNYGDKREVTKFLFFPKRMRQEWRWLEKATWTQQYQIFHYEDYKIGKWVDMNNEYWINL